jgi:hypothetical protein
MRKEGAILPRLAIRTNDITEFLGIGQRSAQTLMAKIRLQLNKGRSQYITIEEFCACSGLNPEIVAKHIR